MRFEGKNEAARDEEREKGGRFASWNELNFVKIPLGVYKAILDGNCAHKLCAIAFLVVTIYTCYFAVTIQHTYTYIIYAYMSFYEYSFAALRFCH